MLWGRDYRNPLGKEGWLQRMEGASGDTVKHGLLANNVSWGTEDIWYWYKEQCGPDTTR